MSVKYLILQNKSRKLQNKSCSLGDYIIKCSLNNRGPEKIPLRNSRARKDTVAKFEIRVHWAKRSVAKFVLGCYIVSMKIYYMRIIVDICGLGLGLGFFIKSRKSFPNRSPIYVPEWQSPLNVVDHHYSL